MSPPHILLVEDDEQARLTLAVGLRHAGYQVTVAADGTTAVDLLEQNTFAVVLTDLVLGDVDGIEVLYTARMQPYHPVVILLTGHGALDTALTAFRNGAYDYLLKPCKPEELLRSVESAVKRQASEQHLREAARILTGQVDALLTLNEPDETASSSHTLRIGDLVLGTSRRDVMFQGQHVVLTPIEYSLLCCLATPPGQIRTYREIVRQTHQVDVSDAEAQSLIRSHIRNVRQKLTSDYLVAVRSTGYYLKDPTL